MANFKDLPVEVRFAIWALALSDADAQAVYFFDPEDFALNTSSDRLDHDALGASDEGTQAETEWEVEREVIVAFPTIMHLCRESREYAKGQLSFREDTVIGIDVPCRPYRPETDAFFVPHRHFDDFVSAVTNAQDDEFKGKLQEGEKAFCREIVHLAFSSLMLMDDSVDALAYVASEMTALRHLCFVFGNTDTLDLTRPLTLFDWEETKAELVPGKPRTKVLVQQTLDSLMDQAAFWEISDEATAPWNEWSGEWLFEFEAKKIGRVRGLI